MESHPPQHAGEMDKALNMLLQEIKEGVKHGFFNYNITCSMVNGRKRQLLITGGKCHKYTIPEEDIKR